LRRRARQNRGVRKRQHADGMPVLAFAIVLAAAGCKRHGATGGAPCDAVGAKFASIARADLAAQKDLDPELAAGVDGLIAPMRDGLVRACKENGWAPAARDCFAGAGDARVLKACYAGLTADQRAALDRAAAGKSPDDEP
jgi:hypothetical protein